MKTFKSFHEASQAAELFFLAEFGHTSGVGVESASGSTIEFYSKQDPGMDDTFSCQVLDGKEYSCNNGGELKISQYEQV